jgi:hypothetical protein
MSRVHSEYSLCSASDRVGGVRAADRAGPGLGEPEVLDLTLGDELGHGAGDVLDRHRRVDPVLVEQVDPVRAQPPQGGIGDPADLLWADVQAHRAPIADVPAELGRNHHLVGQGL